MTKEDHGDLQPYFDAEERRKERASDPRLEERRRERDRDPKIQKIRQEAAGEQVDDALPVDCGKAASEVVKDAERQAVRRTIDDVLFRMNDIERWADSHGWQWVWDTHSRERLKIRHSPCRGWRGDPCTARTAGSYRSKTLGDRHGKLDH